MSAHESIGESTAPPAAPAPAAQSYRFAHLPGGKVTKWVVLGLWLVIFAVAGPLAGKLSGAVSNDPVSYLPKDAQSTQVYQLDKQFEHTNASFAVVTYVRPGGLNANDRLKIEQDASALSGVQGSIGSVAGPFFSTDQSGAQLTVPFDPVDNNISNHVKAVRDVVHVTKNDSSGELAVHVGGPAGLGADLYGVFKSIDGPLLIATAAVVIVLLLITYRSPFLWLVPLICAFGALALAQAVAYLLAKHAGMTVNGLSQGILTVLTFGAGTDYALLIVARYREELRRHRDKHEAMAFALHRAGPAILASAATVIISMLCLLLSVLNSDRGLGPVAAIGIASALLAMTTLLPALLTARPRKMFWPLVPKFGDEGAEQRSIWGRVATAVGDRPRTTWIGTLVILGIMVVGLTGIKATGLSAAQNFPNKPDSVHSLESTAGLHFPNGTGNPATVIGNASTADQLVAAMKAVPGLSVTEPQTAGNLVKVNANYAATPFSPAAYDTIRALRSAVAAVPGADAKVGGQDATNLDVASASAHDRNVVIPVVLAVVLIILCLLLRALIAPLMLIATVVLSFAAALGVGSFVFRHLFHFGGEDVSYPLFSFIFLVALGIDYNIFLMTRIREETLQSGTRAGVLKGLTVTGGVITSAGAVLAATFAVLAVLQLVNLIEIGFTVAFGVLLDTLLVRSVLVPALSLELGNRLWWPSKLDR